MYPKTLAKQSRWYQYVSIERNLDWGNAGGKIASVIYNVFFKSQGFGFCVRKILTV